MLCHGITLYDGTRSHCADVADVAGMSAPAAVHTITGVESICAGQRTCL